MINHHLLCNNPYACVNFEDSAQGENMSNLNTYGQVGLLLSSFFFIIMLTLLNAVLFLIDSYTGGMPAHKEEAMGKFKFVGKHTRNSEV